MPKTATIPQGQLDIFGGVHIAAPRKQQRQAKLASLTPPCVSSSDTSVEAAISIAPTVGNLRGAVLDFIASRNDGATSDEVEVALGLRHQTASARCRELSIMGLVERRPDPNTGKTIRRKTRSGRSAEVLFAVA